MVASNAGRGDRRWRMLQRRLRAEAELYPPTCWLCGEKIDMSLPINDKWSWTSDHIISRHDILTLGLDIELLYDPANLRPAHRTHNSSKGNGVHKAPPKNSRRWG